MKKIVILGNVNNKWIFEYVNNVLLDDDTQVFILSEEEKHKSYFDGFSNIKVFMCMPNIIIQRMRLGMILYGYNVMQILRRIGKVDCIHIQYASLRKLFLLRFLHDYSSKIVVTYWGSDLLRVSERILKIHDKWLKNADIVTVGSSSMEEYFVQKFSSAIQEKLRVVRFGVPGIEPIMDMNPNIETLKRKWGVPPKKVVLTIGYNGSKQQNHIPVINAIGKLDKDIRDKLFLLLPMTYGMTEEYLNTVINSADSYHFDYLILKEYVSSPLMAELCYITDVFIHAQNTDAFSATVQEFLCAEKLLLNPIWIQYHELDTEKVFYLKYNSFDEIAGIIFSYLANGLSEDELKALKRNRKIICDLSSWKKLRENWRTILYMK